VDTHPRYQPVDKIASGSFATVYRGKDLELGREVAIKQIHEQYLSDPQQLERYWAEAQLLASFQHPNIVTIYDLVRDRGWLIMELMQSDLSKVAGRRPMDVNALRTALAHCLRALKFLHAHGIVHGDVKPSNMMIDRRRRVKLGDFGLARRVSDEKGSLIRGTTKYMAPEVVSEEFGEVGPASDLYSLGFAAYELLAGEHFEELFPGLNASGRDRQMAWMMWHAAPDRRLPEISRVLADVPADLAKTIQRLCAKPQAERYRSADEALSDLNIDLKIVKTGEESSATIQRPEKPVEPGSDPKRRLLLIGAFCLSALASLAMLFMSPGGGGSNQATQAPQAVTREGIVHDVRRELMEIDLLTSEGAVVPIKLGKEPKIRQKENQQEYMAVAALKKGDRVEITFGESKGEPRATVEVSRPVTTTGQIRQVDPQRGVVGIVYSPEAGAEVVEMTCEPTAKVQINGRNAEFGQIEPNDRVEVIHLPSKTPDAPRTIIEISARRTLHSKGYVAGVIDQNGRPALRLDRFGKIETLPFAEKCTIHIKGIDENSPLQPADLKPDDRVEISHDVEVTEVQATRHTRAVGTVMQVELPARELVVRSNDGKETRYAVSRDCVIELDGRPAQLDKLKKFYRLELSYDPPPTGPTIIHVIDAKSTQ
jgi:serine/threonine-protein kinase